jgi:hypothetical protein
MEISLSWLEKFENGSGHQKAPDPTGSRTPPLSFLSFRAQMSAFGELSVVYRHVSPEGVLLAKEGRGLQYEDVWEGGGVGQVALLPGAPCTLLGYPYRSCLDRE